MLPYQKFLGKLDNKDIFHFTKQVDYNIDDIDKRVDKVRDIFYRNGRLDRYFEEYFDAERLPRPYFKVALNKDDALSENDYVCRYIEMLTNYILFSKENMEHNDVCEYPINTKNEKRKAKNKEMSLEELREYDERINMLKNIGTKKFPKETINKRDLEEIPQIKDLAIALVKMRERIDKGEIPSEKLYKYTRLMSALRAEQIDIKRGIRRPIEFKDLMSDSTEHDFLNDTGYYNEDGDYVLVSENRIDFANPKHLYELLEHYEMLKKYTYESTQSDMKYILWDLEALVEKAPLKDFERDILTMKIEGYSGVEVSDHLILNYGLKFSESYISNIYKNRIPTILAKAYLESYGDWYYTFKAKGDYKTCSKCGESKLAMERYFSKNKDSKDGFHSICKECRKK